eukprot:g12069.t1
MGGYRRDSAVHLGDLPGDTPECCEPHEPTPHNSSIAGDNVGMVREESCSNLFDDLIQTEDTQPDKSEFEDKPFGRSQHRTETWLWPTAVPEEFAAKIVRKARLQPRDMKYLLGEDGEAGWMHLLEWPSKSKG